MFCFKHIPFYISHCFHNYSFCIQMLLLQTSTRCGRTVDSWPRFLLLILTNSHRAHQITLWCLLCRVQQAFIQWITSINSVFHIGALCFTLKNINRIWTKCLSSLKKYILRLMHSILIFLSVTLNHKYIHYWKIYLSYTIPIWNILIIDLGNNEMLSLKVKCSSSGYYCALKK